MKHTQIIRKQLIRSNINDLWLFMSSPENLQVITPTWMDFKITSNNNKQKMYPGMIITYKVTPLLGIPLNWMTEITHIKKHEIFVDEQRIGPYKIWHHQHIFEKKEDGILMTDIITYSLPFGLLGSLVNKLFVKKRVHKIFDYRNNIVEEIFNKK
tara:strand:+ start:46 stop:510 length:465 start_codon:yes stop_codon:yes gene_type:complete